MSGSVALTGLAALLALAGCFQLSPKSCEVLCMPDQGCPGDLVCMPQAGFSYGLCASPGGSCPPLIPEDAGTPLSDAGSTSDADAGGPLPPKMLCHDGACFTLPDAVRANLVLLLWPSNLPPVGSTVSVWTDQSGQGNDAHALLPSALPRVIPDGVQLDSTQDGSGFVAVNSPSLDFGSGDFAVIVVGGLPSTAPPVSLFRQSDGNRTNSRQIAIQWTRSTPVTGRPEGQVDDSTILGTTDISPPPVAAYGLVRSTDHIELHLNGAVVGSADLPTPGLSTSSPQDLYLGVGSTVGSPADSIEAVIAIRGAITSATLDDLEVFLRTVFVRSTP